MPSANGKIACIPTNPQLYGPDALKSAEELRVQKENRSDWPYEHLFPPENATPVNQITQTPVAVPAPTVTVSVLSYRVPSGQRFIMTAIVNQIFGATFTAGDGLWTVDVNNPIGVVDIQKNLVQGLISIPVTLGTFEIPWNFPRPYEFSPNDLIQVKYTNVSSGATLLVSAFLGYLLPDISRMR